MIQNETQTISQNPLLQTILSNLKYTNEQQNFLSMFKFQYSKINRQELEQLAELSKKFSMVYATSKLDVGKHIHRYIFC